jgi:hypothetical protein
VISAGGCGDEPCGSWADGEPTGETVPPDIQALVPAGATVCGCGSPDSCRFDMEQQVGPMDPIVATALAAGYQQTTAGETDAGGGSVQFTKGEHQYSVRHVRDDSISMFLVSRSAAPPPPTATEGGWTVTLPRHWERIPRTNESGQMHADTTRHPDEGAFITLSSGSLPPDVDTHLWAAAAAQQHRDRGRNVMPGRSQTIGGATFWVVEYVVPETPAKHFLYLVTADASGSRFTMECAYAEQHASTLRPVCDQIQASARPPAGFVPAPSGPSPSP